MAAQQRRMHIGHPVLQYLSEVQTPSLDLFVPEPGTNYLKQKPGSVFAKAGKTQNEKHGGSKKNKQQLFPAFSHIVLALSHVTHPLKVVTIHIQVFAHPIFTYFSQFLRNQPLMLGVWSKRTYKNLDHTTSRG